MSLLIALALYAIVAWYRPRVALGVLLALLPTYLVRFSLLGIPMTLLEGFILMLAVAVLVFGRYGSVSRGVPPPLPPLQDGRGEAEQAASPFADRIVVLAVLWVIFGALAAMWSDAGVRAWGIWKAYIVEPVLVYFVIRALAQSDGGLKASAPAFSPRKHVVLPLLIGASGVAGIAIWQHWTGYGIPFPWFSIEARRVTSVFGYPNAVGLYLAPLIPLAFGMLAVARKDERDVRDGRGTLQAILALLFLFAVSIAAIAAVFFTKGAGAMVAVATGLVALIVFRVLQRFTAQHARGAALAMVVGWVAACLVVTAWLPFQPERPRTGTHVWQKLTFQQWSGSVRLSQYREMWELIADHPARGAGLAGYPIAIQQYKEKQDVETFTYPHNLLLAVWSEMGLLGLLVFLALLLVFFARAFAQRRSASILAAMCALLVFGLVDIPAFKNDLAVQFWVMLALGTVGRGRLIAHARRGITESDALR